MRRALKLAKRGEGRVSPNPMVGAVIMRDGRIIGEGYHHKFGTAHAEINAIASAKESLEGSTFYVSLEPCTHFGKTPPCIDSVLKSRPAAVIIGTRDPNPLVSGKGIRMLEKRGIKVRIGVLEEQCRALNEKFFKFMSSGNPFLTLKFAQSLDGRIAAAGGDSKWISSEQSRKLAHRGRALHDAVLVGMGTIIADDPELTVRLSRGRNPVRIVVDSRLRIPLTARILGDQDAAKTVVVTTKFRPDKGEGRDKQRKLIRLEHLGVETLIIEPNSYGQVDLKILLAELGRKNISSVLVEGGAGIITAFLKEGLTDRVLVFTAPKIIGTGIEPVGDLGIKKVKDAVPLAIKRVFRSGEDIVVDARTCKKSSSGIRASR